MRRILLTGATGGVGARLRKLLPSIYPGLILSDITQPRDLSAQETFIKADLSDFAEVRAAVSGIDSIIHLGGYSVEGPWDAILNANIIGTYNLFEAARLEGVKRIVFASSNHVVGFYPRTETIQTSVTLRPDSRYGVSKAFGEALAAFYAYKHGLGCLCIRIGNVGEAPLDERRLAIWLKTEDLVSLIRIGLERTDLVYEVVYGMSDNERAWWNNKNAEHLGFRPSGRSEDFAGELLAKTSNDLVPDSVAEFFQGGPFCSSEFSGDLARIKNRPDN